MRPNEARGRFRLSDATLIFKQNQHFATDTTWTRAHLRGELLELLREVRRLLRGRGRTPTLWKSRSVRVMPRRSRRRDAGSGQRVVETHGSGNKSCQMRRAQTSLVLRASHFAVLSTKPISGQSSASPVVARWRGAQTETIVSTISVSLI